MTLLHTSSGWIHIRPVHHTDAELLHRWFTNPHSRFWGELDASCDHVRTEITRLASSPNEAAFILERSGTPVAMTQLYDPAQVLLCNHYDQLGLGNGDIGMHLLCAPPTTQDREHGLTSAIMAAVVTWLFHAPEAAASVSLTHVERIVVEPDRRNRKILSKNALAGFNTLPGGESIELDGKNACIQAVCRAGFDASALRALARYPMLPCVTPAPHLTGPAAQQAEGILVAKALRELIHERVLHPTATQQPGEFTVNVGDIVIQFQATLHPLEHYTIDPHSIHTSTGEPVGLLTVVENATTSLGIAPQRVHTYLEELSSTLAMRARVESLLRPTVAELTECATVLSPAAYLQFIESAMVGGHPGFIANSGRAGFGEAQSQAYAPEMGRSQGLVWVAVRRDMAVRASISDMSVEEITDIYVPQWRSILSQRGYNPDSYVPMPLHPWQWEHKVTSAFADALVRDDLVFIGEGPDLMHPQQSLRTFFNMTRPQLPYVKTAVAVRNMGFTRGLSPKYMSVTPAINQWLGEQIDSDPDFRAHNVRLLKEIAAIGFDGDVYHRSAAAGRASDGPHQKMIAALWRQSPIPLLRPGRIAVTLAAVLHTDAAGRSLAAEWIRRSGLKPADWVAKLLNVYLRPAIRALAEYDIVFMLHSENVILELDNWAPAGSFFKDLGEEVAVVNAAREVPANISRIQTDDGSIDDEERASAIHTDIFDGVLRHLGALLADENVMSDAQFWSCVRACVDAYWADYPESGATLPLLSADFRHTCLNRLQVRNPEEMIVLGEENPALPTAGRIANPIA